MPLGVLVTGDDASFRMQASLFSENRPTCGITLDLRDDQPERLAVRAAEEIRPLLGEPLAHATDTPTAHSSKRQG